MQSEVSSNKEGFNNSLYGFLRLVLDYRKIFIIVFIVSSILSVTITLMLPNWYSSTVSVIPPKGNDLMSLISGGGSSSSALSKLASVGLGASLQNMGSYNYLAILESRSVKQQIINEFNFVEVYEMEDDPWEKVMSEFEDHFTADIDVNEYIAISFEDKDPERAAAVVSRFAELLNTKSIALSSKEANQNKVFLERRLIETRDTLQVIEAQLATFFKDEEFIFIPENANTISEYADIYKMKKIKEIELELMKSEFNSSSEILNQKRKEIELLNQEIEKVPNKLITSIQIYRDYLVYNELLEFLTPAYEQAKLEEVKSTPVVLILDEAIPAEYKSKPRRSILCIISVMLSLLGTFALILIRERVDFNQILNSYEGSE